MKNTTRNILIATSTIAVIAGAVLTLTAAPVPVGADTNYPGTSWNLIFSDEFDGSSDESE